VRFFENHYRRRIEAMSKAKISKIIAREIIDCRGWPTIQADVWVNGELKGRADVPAGRSTGTHSDVIKDWGF
jgi:enolase